MHRKTFEDLYRAWEWRPIAGCEGRYTLRHEDKALSIATLTGMDLSPAVSRVSGARDVVLVFDLVDGGLISYLRPEGTVLHTLNTAAGFQRKHSQLEICHG